MARTLDMIRIETYAIFKDALFKVTCMIYARSPSLLL